MVSSGEASSIADAASTVERMIREASAAGLRGFGFPPPGTGATALTATPVETVAWDLAKDVAIQAPPPQYRQTNEPQARDGIGALRRPY